MLTCLTDRPAPIACAFPVRVLPQFAAALAPRRCPPGIFGPEDFLGIIMQEDDSKFGWFCHMGFGNIRRRLPDHLLSAECLSFEYEMIEPFWMAVLIASFRRFTNRNFDGYREFLQSHSAF